jgi:hypothetical protein
MKKQVIYLSIAIITGAWLLSNSTATHLPVKASAAKDAGAVKYPGTQDEPRQSPPGSTFPGIIYIEM